MKYRFIIPVFLCAFLLQGTLINAFAILGATPNLILCAMISIVFMYRDSFGTVVTACVFQCLCDLTLGIFAGPGAIAIFLVGIAVLFASEELNKEHFGTMLMVSAASTLCYNLIFFGITWLLGGNYSFVYVLKLQPLYIAYNLAVCSIAYLLLIRRVVKYRQDRFYKK